MNEQNIKETSESLGKTVISDTFTTKRPSVLRLIDNQMYTLIGKIYKNNI